MTINNSKQEMTSEYRQLQYELQCQEALLILMQKLKTNQRINSQTNNNIKQRTTTPTPVVNATKLNNSITTPTKTSSVYKLFIKIKKIQHNFCFFYLEFNIN
jgi:hypothetical protein